MNRSSRLSVPVPFTADSSLSTGLHVLASVGGSAPHRFQVDTGSVGVVVPRSILSAAYQDFDPSQDVDFGYVSSGTSYRGQWVSAPVVLGVPDDWDGTGSYPVATVDVFAVDEPDAFDGGMLGIGFAIGGKADGGPKRNPLLALMYEGEALRPGYVLRSTGLDTGVASSNAAGFRLVDLQRNDADSDWMQPLGSLALPDGFSIDLPVLVDSGVDQMLLWLSPAQRPPSLAGVAKFPRGVEVQVVLPPSPGTIALRYSFVTGDTSDPAVPAMVEWRDGRGINTGRNVLANTAYLYDAEAGAIGFGS